MRLWEKVRTPLAMLLVLIALLGLALLALNILDKTPALIACGLGFAGLVLLVLQTIGGRRTAAGVEELQVLARRVAQGEIMPDSDYSAKGELGGLCRDMQAMEQALDRQITHISRTLRRISHYGDFTFHVDMVYPGRFAPIHDSLEELIESLLDTFSQMRDVSGEVYAHAQRIMEYAQEISNSSSDQAASIEEISATSTMISEGILDSVDEINSVNAKTQEMGARIIDCRENMEQVVQAMNNMEQSAAQIVHITKTIDDIAFQTNILALNAAVEAARAGEAGQGFAVVADEVRSLANHTASAAKETTVLIKTALESIRAGSNAVGATAEMLRSVAGGAEETSQLVKTVSDTLHDRASRFAEVTENTFRVANLAQSNMAATQANIQVGEELTEQAKVLTAIAARVKLDEDGINPLDQEKA
ncbi:MAG: methyl-accepting chemotaxis protein [Eubacteriales bacterium]|nr:methyl-accepting chemotaxis protein [Eubacteriales bacterium]